MSANVAGTIVVAEDDDEDFLLCMQAFSEAGLSNPVRRVKDGEELMELLLRPGEKEPAPAQPLLILLDLRLPKKSGWEALLEIKSHPRLRRVPVVVFTTSSVDEEIARAYDLGGNSFIRKPTGIDECVAVARAIKSYWLDVVELPRA